MSISPVTIVIFVILAIVVGGMYFIAHKLEEFEKVYNYVTMAAVIAVLGTAVYLAFAMPSIAGSSPASRTKAEAGTVIVDDSNLLQE